MNAFKEMWIEAFDEKVNELHDQGISWDRAYKLASDDYSDEVYDRAKDIFADRVDNIRKMEKEN